VLGRFLVGLALVCSHRRRSRASPASAPPACCSGRSSGRRLVGRKELVAGIGSRRNRRLLRRRHLYEQPILLRSARRSVLRLHVRDELFQDQAVGRQRLETSRRSRQGLERAGLAADRLAPGPDRPRRLVRCYLDLTGRLGARPDARRAWAAAPLRAPATAATRHARNPAYRPGAARLSSSSKGTAGASAQSRSMR
jgi:hypothetical protein